MAELAEENEVVTGLAEESVVVTDTTGQELCLRRKMQFTTRPIATQHIKDFALAQGKCAMTSTDPSKTGGSSTLYVCSSATPCSFYVRVVKTQRRNCNFIYIGSFNAAHEGCSGVPKPTTRQVSRMQTAVAAVHSDSALQGPSLSAKIQALEGITVPMRTLYRAREVLLQDTSSDYLNGCQRVKSLLQLFNKANPGSCMDFQLSPDGRFRRAFLSHPDVEHITPASQRVLGVDGAFLKHKGADNVMLVMVGRDGNLENILLAVAICPSEDEENCLWFFEWCQRAGISVRELPVFSDRGSGLIAAASKMGITLHYCTRHIIGNMKSKFKGQITECVEGIV
jgi:hypothetical protein